MSRHAQAPKARSKSHRYSQSPISLQETQSESEREGESERERDRERDREREDRVRKQMEREREKEKADRERREREWRDRERLSRAQALLEKEQRKAERQSEINRKLKLEKQLEEDRQRRAQRTMRTLDLRRHPKYYMHAVMHVLEAENFDILRNFRASTACATALLTAAEARYVGDGGNFLPLLFILYTLNNNAKSFHRVHELAAEVREHRRHYHPSQACTYFVHAGEGERGEKERHHARQAVAEFLSDPTLELFGHEGVDHGRAENIYDKEHELNALLLYGMGLKRTLAILKAQVKHARRFQSLEHLIAVMWVIGRRRTLQLQAKARRDEILDEECTFTPKIKRFAFTNPDMREKSVMARISKDIKQRRDKLLWKFINLDKTVYSFAPKTLAPHAEETSARVKHREFEDRLRRDLSKRRQFDQNKHNYYIRNTSTPRKWRNKQAAGGSRKGKSRRI